MVPYILIEICRSLSNEPCGTPWWTLDFIAFCFTRHFFDFLALFLCSLTCSFTSLYPLSFQYLSAFRKWVMTTELSPSSSQDARSVFDFFPVQLLTSHCHLKRNKTHSNFLNLRLGGPFSLCWEAVSANDLLNTVSRTRWRSNLYFHTSLSRCSFHLKELQ